jgi:hypothetical protein
MHFFCKKHPFYFAGSENLCTFVLILKVTYKDNAAASLSSYQETIINLNFISYVEIRISSTANDKDWHKRERTEIRSKLGTIGKHIRKGGDRVCLQTYRYATYNG